MVYVYIYANIWDIFIAYMDYMGYGDVTHHFWKKISQQNERSMHFVTSSLAGNLEIPCICRFPKMEVPPNGWFIMEVPI